MATSRVKHKVAYFHDPEVGSFYYGAHHPFKPHRMQVISFLPPPCPPSLKTLPYGSRLPKQGSRCQKELPVTVQGTR
eukprot:1256004-Rhodomonas_salina.2